MTDEFNRKLKGVHSNARLLSSVAAWLPKILNLYASICLQLHNTIELFSLNNNNFASFNL